ncbi:MAG: (d)CMP kinase [Candidatus Omnitrophota bacterium]
MIIAIDGPAGSGKTTIAKLLSRKLSISYLDTGATYRALTLKALENNIDVKNEAALVAVAKKLVIRFEGQKVYLNEKDVSGQIRTPLIDKNISAVVEHKAVRQVMVALQRSIASHGDFVVEGRDITTVVFPQAEYKFYLDADPAIRANRRHKELESKGVTLDFKEVKQDLYKRDEADKTRKIGALTVASDAVYIDTTHLNIDEVVTAMCAHIHQAGNK